MKKIIALTIVIVCFAALAGCSGWDAQLIGDWELVSNGTAQFGKYLRFTKDGEMYCTPGVGKADILINAEKEFDRMSRFYEISYKAKENGIVEMTIDVFGEKVKIKIEYSVDGDVLIFDEKTYKRMI